MPTKGLFFALIASFAIGALIVVNKAVLNANVDPFEYVTATYVVVFFLCFPFIVRHPKKLLLYGNRFLFRLLVLAMLATLLGPLIQLFGQRYTSAVNASFLTTLNALFTLPFAVWLLKEKTVPRMYIFVFVLFLGIYLLVVGPSGYRLVPGDILIITGAVIMGFSNAFAKTLMRNAPGELVARGQMLMGSLLLFILFLIFSPSPSFDLAGFGGWYAVSGFLTWTVVVALYKAFALSGPIQTMFVTVTYPLIATLGSLVFLQESLTVVQTIGGALMLVSTYQLMKYRNTLRLSFDNHGNSR